MNGNFIKFSFVIFILVCITMCAYALRLEATEKKEFYPNYLLHNATQSCIRGVVQLIISIDPSLQNRYIPPAIQQQLIGHCSCVVDKIRKKYTVQEYYSKMNDYEWIKTIWGKKGEECMNEGYLDGVIVRPSDNETNNETKDDNKTKSSEQKSGEKPTFFQG
ncbi:MAG: hypothetical protein QGH83_10145 [Candidatus Pacebacteria bacterium]|nr:hypothetical protein [Candidatus Paceibacterota bacterium]